MKIFVVTILFILLLHTNADFGKAQRNKSGGKRNLQTSQESLTPLMRAAGEGRITTVRRLLRKGANVNKKNETGITALMLAAHGGHVEVVKALLAAGADPNASGGFAHAPIFTVLTMAMNPSNRNWTEMVDTLIAAGAKINPSSDYPIAPLNDAIRQRDTQMIKALLARGADVNWKNSVGNTPLVTAIAVAEPKPEIVKVLLVAGADPNIPRLQVGNEKITLLSYVEGWLKESKNKDREEILRLLKEAGAKR
jgi:uncharacterized protein